MVDKNKCQVFLFESICNFPAFFATHPWFVVNRHGEIHRYEGRFVHNIDGKTIHVDALPPFCGIGFWRTTGKLKWPARLISVIEGPLAERTACVIEGSLVQYDYLDESSLIGPNSNTYAQWVLNRVTDWKVSLSKVAIGKNFKH